MSTLPCCHKITLNNVPDISIFKLFFLYRGKSSLSDVAKRAFIDWERASTTYWWSLLPIQVPRLIWSSRPAPTIQKKLCSWISICASQNESARAVKFSSTVQPKCLNMKCIHTYIHTYIYSHIQTQTQITHAQTITHAFIHMVMDARMHKHTHTQHSIQSFIHVKL